MNTSEVMLCQASSADQAQEGEMTWPFPCHPLPHCQGFIAAQKMKIVSETAARLARVAMFISVARLARVARINSCLIRARTDAMPEGRAHPASALAVAAPTSGPVRASPPWQPYQRSMNPLARNPVRSIKRLASDLHSLCTGGAP